MIDFFSRTGLYIVGIKVHQMSVAEAVEFYPGPVKEVLRTRLKDVVASKAKVVIEKELGFKVPAAEEKQLGEILGRAFGDNQFDNIVRFMSGRSQGECDAKQLTEPGTEKCIALVYEGVEAVRKIRDVLGPTEHPSKAPPGSIRREFGPNHHGKRIARTRAIPEDNAKRELATSVRVAENNFRKCVEEF